MTVIVGIDPSLSSTGVCVINGRAVGTWTVRSQGKRDVPWDARGKRIRAMASNVAAFVPDASVVVIEAPSYGSAANAGHQHDRSGMWWELHRLLVERGCLVLPVAPTIRAKYATGKGNAGKDAVLAAVVRRYPDVDVGGNDVADALVLAAIGARLCGQPIDKLPGTHLAALATLPNMTPAGSP